MDREKVIERLEYCAETRDGYVRDCINDALALLKEQEASWISVPHKKARICSRCYADEPYKFADEDADVYDYCPNCGARMINRR